MNRIKIKLHTHGLSDGSNENSVDKDLFKAGPSLKIIAMFVFQILKLSYFRRRNQQEGWKEGTGNHSEIE